MSQIFKYICRTTLLLVVLFVLVACSSNREPTPQAEENSLPTVALPDKLADVVLQSASGIAPLDGLDKVQQVAQAVALNAAELSTIALSPDGNDHLRTEVFGVYPARDSDITADSTACATTTCYRVDIYNFAHNITFVALSDVENGQLVDLMVQANATPDLPPHLVQQAVEIATTSQEVIAELGFDPAPDDPTMPNVKTAFNSTKCERSSHLCVAPTFIVDGRALWAIVDLVDEVVVATRWTDLGDFSAGLPTQELIARDAIFAEYCETDHSESRNGWVFDYILTATDGLRISNVQFADTLRFDSIKLVDYHVSYSTRDGFGYSDAIGCPKFSSAAVVALDAPVFEDIVVDDAVVGFALVQDYVHPQWPQPCNYRYKQRYEFYNDGRLRVMAANLGRGCGNDATYRFLYRIDPAGKMTFAEWDGAIWQPWQEEQWVLDDGQATSAENTLFQFGDYEIEPNRGQFGDGSRGDNALVYVVKHKTDEGDADMVTLGVCCNTNYEQGPEEYIDGEIIAEQEIVIWYVPQIKNDDTAGSEYCWADQVVEDGLFVDRVWPCWAGPMFVLGEGE